MLWFERRVVDTLVSPDLDTGIRGGSGVVRRHDAAVDARAPARAASRPSR